MIKLIILTIFFGALAKIIAQDLPTAQDYRKSRQAKRQPRRSNGQFKRKIDVTINNKEEKTLWK